jgi:hypothetical protein
MKDLEKNKKQNRAEIENKMQTPKKKKRKIEIPKTNYKKREHYLKKNAGQILKLYF